MKQNTQQSKFSLYHSFSKLSFLVLTKKDLIAKHGIGAVLQLCALCCLSLLLYSLIIFSPLYKSENAYAVESAYAAENAYAAEQDLILYNSSVRFDAQGAHVLVSSAIRDPAQLRDLLKDGASLEFLFNFSINQESFWWGLSQVLAKEKQIFLRHDPLSREFVLFSPDNSIKEKRDKNLNTLLEQAFRNMEFTLFDQEELSELRGEEAYQLSLQSELLHSEAPPWLMQSSLFWSPEIAKSNQLNIPFVLVKIKTEDKAR